MRTSRVAGLVFLAAALAQQQQTVEITSEPSHHLVLENDYVRVFNVMVAPKATTLIHRHNHDYLFVTLGDSDIVNARVGEKQVPLRLKDGEVRFTPGNFAHAAINASDRPFHNVTIELLQPSGSVKQCAASCEEIVRDKDKITAPQAGEVAASGQWSVWLHTLPPSGRLENQKYSSPRLFVAVSDLDLSLQGGDLTKTTRRSTGDITWISPGTPYMVLNNGPGAAQFVILDFKAEKQKP